MNETIWKVRHCLILQLYLELLLDNSDFLLTSNDPFTSGIDFVKINDPDAAQRFNILHTPALVYFRKKVPLVYDGECCRTNRLELVLAVALVLVCYW